MPMKRIRRFSAIASSRPSAVETGTETAPDGDRVPVGAGLTAEQNAALELANAQNEEMRLELARVTGAMNKTAYEAERRTFAEQYGIPPRIFDLARSVLEGEGHTLELSNGKTIDTGAIVRAVLKEFGRTVKALDLSTEAGTSLDGSAEAARAAADQAAQERGELVTHIRRTTGL